MDNSSIPALVRRSGALPKCAYATCGSHCAASDDPNAPAQPLMKCAGCLATYYCSKQHQRSDWQRHKAWCKSMQAKLTAMAAAKAEAHLAHSAGLSMVPPASSTRASGLLTARKCGSNTQLCLDEREQQQFGVAAMASLSMGSSCRSSVTESPPVDTPADGGSASSSVYGSMADLVTSTPYHTAKGRKYSILQSVGNPKRARFLLTVIRERRSSIGAGEAARLAAAAAAASANGKSPPDAELSSENEEEIEFTPTPIAAGARKRPAGGSTSSTRRESGTFSQHEHATAGRCSSDADATLATRLEYLGNRKKDHRRNVVLDLSTDARFQLDAMVPRLTAFNLRVRRLAMCAAVSLREYGWCVVDHFLGDAHAKAIHHETISLYMTPGLFADGQLMKQPPPDVAAQMPQLQSPKDVRSDQIYWFDNRVDRGTHISFLVSMVDSVVFHLRERIPPYEINGRSRAMIACYPGEGTKYVRHVDNPDRDGRCITSIYYLNEHWIREYGGILRLYPETSPGPIDIQPLFDRLLLFWSDRRNPHEVMPAYRNRFAITIWYFDAMERAEALVREQQQNKSAAASSSVLQSHCDAGSSSTTSIKLANRPTRVPRSASYAELNSSTVCSLPITTTVFNSTNALTTQPHSPGPSFTPSTQMQQQLRLDSPHHSLSVAGVVPPSVTPEETAGTSTQQIATSALRQFPFGKAQSDVAIGDYTHLLSAEVISKLMTLSAGRNIRSQLEQQDQEEQRTAGPEEDIDMRSNVASRSSSEVDPVGSAQ